MSQKIKFTKMHGTGNDYIYVNTMQFPLENPEELSIRWSKYHTGIGSDGLILIGSSEIADFSMHIYNNDGSEAMMCGNGTRCVAKYVYEKGLTRNTVVTLETLSGIKILHLHVRNGIVESVTVDMGVACDELIDRGRGPQPMREEVLTTEAGRYTGSAISMGNPHFVIYVDDITQVNLEREGRFIECHPYFKDRTNVEFAQVLADGSVRMRVWERGSGITMACGTGACATAVSAITNHRTGKPVLVRMDGGDVEIDLNEEGHVMMTGPAAIVFEGEIEI